jgi:hypothetical protein
MSNTITPSKVPVTYWIVALLSLAWNSFGAVDYLMTKLRNMDYLTSMVGTPELARQMLAMVEGMPLWAHALWGLGVWSSILGSILLLARSRHAPLVFLISLVSAALSFAYQATLTMPAGLDTPMMKAMPLVILAAIVLQWWWARRKLADGTLR